MKYNTKRLFKASALIFCIITIITACSIKKIENVKVSDGELEIQYLDVDQADANLIKLPNSKVLMIDAGGNKTANKLTQYILDQGITKIDYLIGTHPHEDHIGGLDNVIDNFDIGEVYMPKISDSQTPTTKTYEDVLVSIKNKGLKINQGKAGMTIFDSDGLKLEFLAPNSASYEGLNSYSIVAKLSYNSKSFLFMGDAESDSEKEILSKFDVKADILKCGHHGSSTSSKNTFIKAVSPIYAIISCGADNSYGHPNKGTLDNFSKNNVIVYRTDKDKTIKAFCDGVNIEIKTGGVDLTS